MWERGHAPGSVMDDDRIAEAANLVGHDPAFRRTLDRLVKDGLLQGQEVSSHTSWGYHIRGLTPRGMRELGEWPQVNPTTDIEAKRRIRAAVIYDLYDSVQADVTSACELHEIGRDLGITQQEVEDAGRYLEGEGLIEFVTQHGEGGQIAITHEGVVEVEAGQSDPSKPTAHLPEASQIININAPVNSSQIGQAVGSLLQDATYNGPVGGELVQLVASVRKAIEGLDIDLAELGLIEQDLRSLEAIADRDDSTARRIANHAMHSLRSIIEAMVATGAYASLAHFLTVLPH